MDLTLYWLSAKGQAPASRWVPTACLDAKQARRSGGCLVILSRRKAAGPSLGVRLSALGSELLASMHLGRRGRGCNGGEGLQDAVGVLGASRNHPRVVWLSWTVCPSVSNLAQPAIT